MFVEYNANPLGKRVGDCVIRALCMAMEWTWDRTFVGLSIEASEMKDMPSSNAVWGSFLRKQGWQRHAMPDTCPDCYTVADFCREHPEGVYILALPEHVVYVKDGTLMDTWDSSDLTVLYYWTKGE